MRYSCHANDLPHYPLWRLALPGGLPVGAAGLSNGRFHDTAGDKYKS